MKRVFILDFDEPHIGWMNAYTLRYLLEQICINTKFDVFEITNIFQPQEIERLMKKQGGKW